MIFHWDIIQGSLSWYELRYGKIGGSTSKGLFVDSDTLLNELISARLEPFEMDDDSYESPAMQRGNELEPMARRAMSQYVGVEFKECGWIQSDVGLIGISPDGISECGKVSIEIKCPGRKKHTETLRGGVIPLEHCHQIVHSFTANKSLDRLYFCSYRPESQYGMLVKEIDRSTMINLGTRAKPVVKPVNEWADIARSKAIDMETFIGVELERLGGV